ncbi:hypothetical protein [Thiolapillus brandeum]|uniref:Nuclear transport factor 2 family protein n=1 Tax=Thiolapillus brandeum TaxID=1076588 RepID=A0A7U6GGX9_9GAMM|nr:hypothetical protein [Thiolapillus brandeum]BAO43429.1 conserved hypothetical protein [Thiolapillus brandeum]
MTIEKSSMNQSRMVLGFLLGAAVVLSAGCSEKDAEPTGSQQNVANVTQSATKTREQQVAQRAQEHMDALIARNWEKAYAYLPPATRQLKPLQVYANRMNGGAMLRTAADIKEVDCEENVCTVTIDLAYIYTGTIEAMRGRETRSLLKEKWILSQGNWWLAEK